MDQSEYKTIIYEKDENEPKIVFITLNRPDKSNAISIGPSELDSIYLWSIVSMGVALVYAHIRT